MKSKADSATGWVTVMELSKGIQLLIGTDMIRKFGRLVIEFGENGEAKAELGKPEELVAVTAAEEEDEKLRAAETRDIPPRSVIFIKCK